MKTLKLTTMLMLLLITTSQMFGQNINGETEKEAVKK